MELTSRGCCIEGCLVFGDKSRDPIGRRSDTQNQIFGLVMNFPMNLELVLVRDPCLTGPTDDV